MDVGAGNTGLEIERGAREFGNTVTAGFYTPIFEEVSQAGRGGLWVWSSGLKRGPESLQSQQKTICEE